MNYVQDKVHRVCKICDKEIKFEERMIDLFRRSFGKPREKSDCCWVHDSCARTLLEKCLIKKWERQEIVSTL